jgi:hypothetical protein
VVIKEVCSLLVAVSVYIVHDGVQLGQNLLLSEGYFRILVFVVENNHHVFNLRMYILDYVFHNAAKYVLRRPIATRSRVYPWIGSMFARIALFRANERGSRAFLLHPMVGEFLVTEGPSSKQECPAVQMGGKETICCIYIGDGCLLMQVRVRVASGLV